MGSSELSEAIRAMIYGMASRKPQYLADVPPSDDPPSPESNLFLLADWKAIGTTFTLVDLIEDITADPRETLLLSSLRDEFIVAQRLSWAANRETTRTENWAYSLLGIFDINMPIFYGERERAFRRLQDTL
ncbi:hypothetical protein DICSQDRAFT_171648 [Dichomitus squalens LYAD-421 SS1]|uniref:Uncharacterized protein n=1 Tax=Dichomitus squalens (strain LYAD-421) TaxID=732165 RepID=R7SY60_DICSQ|nr:uncharacterized protein DICSQDRAFT_171648 [Dichomitus squalens LYAD-421 SS1]EJF59922.1 hypothetical protein DICSQDRAFT_171648 [Dichomitus squalens LYAD-421 SS1]